MRSITPVIAIVVLLLMTVAAAGMAFLTITTYQSEAQSGSEGGLEKLATTSSTNLKIESVSAGKILLRNLGSKTFDNPSFYVDGRPLSTSGPSECEPGKVCVFTVTETVSCTGNNCELSMGRDLSINSQTVNEAELNVPCGDGTCDYPGENAWTCWEDCGIHVVAYPYLTSGGMYQDIHYFIWNDTGIYCVGGITNGPGVNELKGIAPGSDERYMACFLADDSLSGDQWLNCTIYKDSVWEQMTNLTMNSTRKAVAFDYNTNDKGIVAWSSKESPYYMNYTIYNGSSFGVSQQYPHSTLPIIFDVKYISDQDIRILYQEIFSLSPHYDDLLFSRYNGASWSEPINITKDNEASALAQFAFNGNNGVTVFLNATVQGPSVDFIKTIVQYSFWTGSAWGPVQTLYDGGTNSSGTQVAYDPNGNIVAIWANSTGRTSPPYSLQYSVWSGSSWSTPEYITSDLIFGGGLLKNEFGEILAAYLSASDYYYYILRWNGTGWSNLTKNCEISLV
jgi:flagellin-like protein